MWSQWPVNLIESSERSDWTKPIAMTRQIDRKSKIDVCDDICRVERNEYVCGKTRKCRDGFNIRFEEWFAHSPCLMGHGICSICFFLEFSICSALAVLAQFQMCCDCNFHGCHNVMHQMMLCIVNCSICVRFVAIWQSYHGIIILSWVASWHAY